MVARLRGGAADASATVTIHLALAMILSPLLFIKVLIARFYRNQHNLLMPIGLTIFVLAFVLVASTAGPYLARPSRVERVSIDPAHRQAVTIDLNQTGDLMQKRCSKCHNLDRVVGARKDAEGWRKTVDRMRAMPAAGIPEAEGRAIVSYLVSQSRLQGSETAAKMEVARALVDQRCSRCHSLDRVYKTVQTPDWWRDTVARMVEYAAGSAGALQPGEDQQILAYLDSAQTPDAVSKRKAEMTATRLAGRSLVAPGVEPAPVSPAPPSAFDPKTIGFLSFVGLATVGLVIRRPGARAAPPEKPSPRPSSPPPRPPATPFLLELVQIAEQTPDSKTIRFAVRSERKLDALPGQFLTFSFLFDGRKETRCYSICSSPARSGYIEITPKRVANGCVSLFLNDRASIGMTVEATGPFGQFCWNHHADRKIVLIAAGSGVTPMAAMLRYMDDLCVEADATLLYCVRTREDIMFRQEFDSLQLRLKNFGYHVALSKPDPDWSGLTGHIDREMIGAVVPELDGRVFFLCGPPPFMEAARSILASFGVLPERIRQETFGGAGAQPKPVAPGAQQACFPIEFSRSGKSAAAAEGQTLLEAAAAAGVDIPSACRQGQCGTCKTRLLEGQVRMTAENGLDAESKARGFILTCVGHAEGAVKLDA
jgi:ferredoxin-NADP reductase